MNIGSYSLEKKNRLILFWLILAALFVTRIILFTDVPGDINQDEALAGYNSYTLLHNGRDSFGYSFPMYLTAWGSGMNALESYLAIPFVAIFGLSAFSLRLVPLIVSMFSLAVVYKLIREHLHNDRLALVGMAFVGIMPWHFMISRWALESNLAPAFLLFGMYFFLKGADNDKFFMLSALFYGLSIYSYATIWIILPFIILAEIIYLIYRKKIHFTRYTIISAGILALMALPAILFLLVNYDVIGEIKTPVLSIPRMVVFRNDDLFSESIFKNFKGLAKILIKGRDGLPWNSIRGYGCMYMFTIWISGFGVIVSFARSINNMRKRINHRIATGEKHVRSDEEKNKPLFLPFFLFIHLVAAGIIGLMIDPNINRINIIFLPLIGFALYGLYFIFVNIKPIKKRLIWVPFVVYAFSFISFEVVYFTDYKDKMKDDFCAGVADSMDFINNTVQAKKVYVTEDINYSRVLFYDRTDVDEYLNTVKFIDYPSDFIDVDSFGKYCFVFDYDSEPEKNAVYLLDDSYEDTQLVSSLVNLGYSTKTFENYTVYYPKTDMK